MWDGIGHLLVGRHLNSLRRKWGLRPVSRIFQWWFSPQRVIGMFPDWYGPPQEDWPPQIRLTGFPLYDAHPGCNLPDDLLDFCRSGPPPIAFTFGTGMMHAKHLFRAALDACRAINRRAIFLTKYTDQLPTPLPPTICHIPFAPFEKLFPHCAAVVHHGGIGTLSQSLVAGVPQLVLPIAYDQLDNAIRVKRLGAGENLPRGRRSASHIAQVLDRIIRAEMQSQCEEFAVNSADRNGLQVAADLVEQLAHRIPIAP
jgi:UDP:flavonoid glycosyltransferase YjiC (YdhE family)